MDGDVSIDFVSRDVLITSPCRVAAADQDSAVVVEVMDKGRHLHLLSSSMAPALSSLFKWRFAPLVCSSYDSKWFQVLDK